jgi:hypothetical protein
MIQRFGNGLIVELFQIPIFIFGIIGSHRKSYDTFLFGGVEYDCKKLKYSVLNFLKNKHPNTIITIIIINE